MVKSAGACAIPSLGKEEEGVNSGLTPPCTLRWEESHSLVLLSVPLYKILTPLLNQFKHRGKLGIVIIRIGYVFVA